jgi:uncharacterized DUF497 family protein
MITWDEKKRQINLAKHGIDFAQCEVIFDHPMVTEEDDRLAYGEQRLRSLGLFYGVVVRVVWVDRGDTLHLISGRKAKKYEQRDYWQTVGR